MSTDWARMRFFSSDFYERVFRIGAVGGKLGGIQAGTYGKGGDGGLVDGVSGVKEEASLPHSKGGSVLSWRDERREKIGWAGGAGYGRREALGARGGAAVGLRGRGCGGALWQVGGRRSGSGRGN